MPDFDVFSGPNSPVTPSRSASNVRNKENMNAPPRPSNGWLRNPAWIDGGVNPPQFYHSREEIDNCWSVAGGVLDGVAPKQEGLDGTLLPFIWSKIAPEWQFLVEDAVAPPSEAEYLISVVMAFLTTDKSSGRGSKVLVKKAKTTKSDHMRVTDMTRPDFIKAFFAVHDLTDQFSPGVHSGPGFKMWWTGSSGGKAGASTIDNDHDFAVALAAISKKNKQTCQVGVEFDVDTMEGFRIRKRVSFRFSPWVKMLSIVFQPLVPRLDTFSEAEQLHGAIIVQLKQKWMCQRHEGEHGEPGHCFIDAAGEHLGLNNRKLKLWAAAIAAADATKHQPPNTVEFDGVRDGRLSMSKPRGRSGPRSALSPNSAPDSTALLMAAMLSLITSHLAPKPPASPSTASTGALPSTPTRNRTHAMPMSPIPRPELELRACLTDFRSLNTTHSNIKGIDFTASEEALAALDFTPDIVSEVPLAHLSEVLGAVQGRTLKFRRFCQEWTERLVEKRRRSV
ncbi:hypothetical protein PLICRDRAFT_163749 [Plicaturopsis crispa FD-325 SS-3]|nr:hypothetical protein PLICRDRAFT_163749 [Plicaturopsis crispa FD-325 SS-3]